MKLRIGQRGAGYLAALALCVAAAALFAARAAGAFESQAAASLYNEGNQLYRDGHYERAIESYRRALDFGTEDARLEYNLGGAYAKTGQLGRARLHLERALALAPSDDDARRNVAIVRARVPGEEQPLGAGILDPLVSFYQRLAPELLAWWAGTLWALIWLCGGGAVLTSEKWARNLRTAAFFAVLPLVALGGIFYARHREISRPYAIVVGEQATVRGGPSTEETELLTLPPGRQVLAGRQRGTWIEVRVPGEFEGWVVRAAVEFVRP